MYALRWAQNDVFIREIGSNGPFRPIVEGIKARFEPHECGDRFAILTDWKAPNHRILIAKPTDEEALYLYNFWEEALQEECTWPCTMGSSWCGEFKEKA